MENLLKKLQSIGFSVRLCHEIGAVIWLLDKKNILFKS